MACLTPLQAFGWGAFGGTLVLAVAVFLAWIWPKQDWFD